MQEVVLSLGSNLGDRQRYLAAAIKMIELRLGKVTRNSSVYETISWGFDSFDFLNQVVIINTELSPMELLGSIKEIEKKLGREEKSRPVNGVPHYYDRTIDIDILFYGKEKINTETLTIPHPRIREREFIMILLQELNIAI